MPAMEAWRRTAKTASVRAQSLIVSVRMAGEALHGAIEGAHQRFVKAIEAADRGSEGLPPEPVPGHASSSEQAAAATMAAPTHVTLAVHRIDRILDVHAACGDLLSLCATSMALQESINKAPWWHEWERHHAAHANAALEGLGYAWLNGDAAMEALSMLEGRPQPVWDEWGPGPEAVIFLDQAKEELAIRHDGSAAAHGLSSSSPPGPGGFLRPD